MPNVDWTEVEIAPSTTWAEQEIAPDTSWKELIEEFYNWDDAIDEYEIANLSWEELG